MQPAHRTAGFQPAGDVPEGIQTAELVEHLVPRILVEDDLDVLQTGPAVQVDHPAHAFAVFADRVLVPGEEQERQIARRVAEGMRSIGLRDQRKDIAEAGGSQDKIALFVRLVQRDHAFVPAEPVKHRVRVFDFAVIALENHIGQEAAPIGHAAGARDRIRKVGGADGARIGADRADQDAAGQLFAVVGQVQAGNQRTH